MTTIIQRNVDVTAEDIERGLPGTCSRCPIALAIQRAVGDSVVGVGPTGFWVNGFCGILPDIAQQFVRDFDNRKPVEPITFSIEWRGVVNRF